MKRMPVLLSVFMTMALLFAFGCSHKASSPVTLPWSEPGLAEGTVGVPEGIPEVEPKPPEVETPECIDVDGDGVCDTPVVKTSYDILKEVKFNLYAFDLSKPAENPKTFEIVASLDFKDGKVVSELDKIKDLSTMAEMTTAIDFEYDDAGRITKRVIKYKDQFDDITRTFAYVYGESNGLVVEGRTEVSKPENSAFKTYISDSFLSKYAGETRTWEYFVDDGSKDGNHLTKDDKRSTKAKLGEDGFPLSVAVYKNIGLDSESRSIVNMEYEDGRIVKREVLIENKNNPQPAVNKVVIDCKTDCVLDSDKPSKAIYKFFNLVDAPFAELHIYGERDDKGRVIKEEVTIEFEGDTFKVSDAEFEYETVELESPPVVPNLTAVISRLRTTTGIMDSRIRTLYPLIFPSTAYDFNAEALLGKGGRAVY